MTVYEGSKVVNLQPMKANGQDVLILRDEEGFIISKEETLDIIHKLFDGLDHIKEDVLERIEEEPIAEVAPRAAKMNFLTSLDIRNYSDVLDGWLFEPIEIDEIINHLEVHRIKPKSHLIVETCRAMEGKIFPATKAKMKYFFTTLNDLKEKERKRLEEQAYIEEIIEKEGFFIAPELKDLIKKLFPQGLYESQTKALSQLYSEYRKQITILDFQKILNGINFKNQKLKDMYPYVRRCIENYINPAPKPTSNQEVGAEPKKELTDEEFNRLLVESRKKAAKQKPEKVESTQASKKEKELSAEEIEQLLADVEF